MRPLIRSLKPVSGIAHVLHLALLVVLPVIIFGLVWLNLTQLALATVVLAKWRMFAVRPRFWAANIRANAIDLMVGLSIVVFMIHSHGLWAQAFWMIIYAGWLVYIKPGTTIPMVTIQAFLGQLAALTALYLTWSDGPVWGLTFLSGLFCFLAARHFLDAFEEPYARMLSYYWGFFWCRLGLVTEPLAALLQGFSPAHPTVKHAGLRYGRAVLSRPS